MTLALLAVERFSFYVFKEPLSFFDKWPFSHSIRKETVVLRSQARINHARNIPSISSTGSLDWEMSKTENVWAPVSIWQASHVSPYQYLGEPLLQCHSVWGLRRFQDHSNWLNPPGWHHLGNGPRFTSRHKWFLPPRDVSFDPSNRRLPNKTTMQFHARKRIAWHARNSFKHGHSFCICRRTWLECHS